MHALKRTLNSFHQISPWFLKVLGERPQSEDGCCVLIEAGVDAKVGQEKVEGKVNLWIA
jgi:hypothetical protein